jgi:hypothetical protein
MNKDCPQESLMSQYVDGELSGEAHSGLVEHIAQCPECAQELEKLQKLKATLALLSSDPSAKQRVRQTLSMPKKKVAFIGRRFWVPLPVAVAILLLLSASIIGNAYYGLLRPVRERIVYKNIVVPPRTPDSEKDSNELKENIDSAVRLRASAGLRRIDSNLLRKRNKKANTGPGKTSKKPFIATLQTDQHIAEFATATEYQLYSVPQIYKGGIHLPEQR